MIGAFLNLSRPLAMQALSNPRILGSLLVGAVGSQQANEITNQLKLGNISLDNVYDTIVNFAASPAVSALRDTPSGQESSPDEAQIEAERKFNEELNRRVTLPSEISIDQILSTPPTTTVPEPLITPDVPEEKVSVDDVGFTPTPALRLEDMIMTAKNPEDLFKDERFQEVLKMAKGDPNVDYRAQDKKDGDYIMEAPQGNTFWTTAGFPGDKMNPAKSVIIYIKPGDYLNLAKKKEDGYNEASFELYKNTNVGISIPKLLMNENEGGYFSVTGHEGRHRAKYFEGLDPDTPIPVQVQLTNKGSDEYVDYTKGYYTHGQSVLNAGKKLEELGFAQNENGGLTKFKVFGYQGDGQKVGEIFEAPKSKFTLSEKNVNDFFETSNEFESIEGRIEDVESRYYGGVGDLGDNQATKTIQKIDGYDDYAMYIKEQAENFLGPQFNAFRITNTKEVMQLLNKQNKNKIKSFTLNPKQAIKFGYFANEAFMDPITTQPRGDLLIIESPIKSDSLVMRGRPEEAEVVSNTAGTSIKQSRIYNPYTGEVVYEPTEGPLVGTQPHQFENLIKTESEISSFINDLAEKSGITSTNEETIGTRQEEGQTTIEALKAQSEESKARDVDRGSQSDQGEYVLKTEEGFEIAPLEQSSDFFTRTMLGEIGTPKSRYEPILNLSELGQTFDIFEEKRSGNFENHIFTSIPTFKEAQVATADALIKSLPQNANVLDIGGTEGGFVNTIAEVRPDVTGFIVDPNVVAEKIFNQQKMPNSYYIREAFTTDKSKFGNYAFDVKDEKKQPISTDFFDANLIEDNSLDAITEKMTFQFIDKGRNNKVKLISEKLKPEGIALFEEKFFTSYDDPEWKANEDKKNQFKLQYYDQKDLTKKQKETLEGMDKRQVTSGDFEKILMKYFNNVAQYWDSGNFKGYVASDSADALNNFLSNLPDLNSEYSNVQTPSFVTKPITKKRRGGPISIPKIDML